VTQLNLYFSRDEFACKDGCGFDVVDAELLQVLTDLREHFQSPVIVKSGCRCEQHNARIKGSPNSQHLLGKAADIAVTNTPASEVQDYLLRVYPNTYGIGKYSIWTHIDVRPEKARW